MDIGQTFVKFLQDTGFATISWQQAVMLVISCVLLYLAIVKQYEPLLLLPIAFGMLLANLPGANLAVQYSNMEQFGELVQNGQANMIDILYLGVKLGVYPPLIFMGVGAMTDFGPLIANPKSLMSVLALNVNQNYVIVVTAQGEDEEEAIAGMEGFVRENL